MKKLFFYVATATIFCTGLNSCSKCEICTKASSPEIRICEKDYNNNTQYGLAIDAAEAGGYTCKKSL